MVSVAKQSILDAGGEMQERGLTLRIPSFGDVVVIGKNGIIHGLRPYGAPYMKIDNRFNADILSVLGDVLLNTVAVNELKPRDKKTKGATILLGAARVDKNSVAPVVVIVNHVLDTNETPAISVYPLKSIAVRKNDDHAFDTANIFPTATEITVSDLIEAVKDILPIFSQDVYEHFKQERPKAGDFVDSLRFSITADAVVNDGLPLGLAEAEYSTEESRELPTEMDFVEAFGAPLEWRVCILSRQGESPRTVS